MTDETEALRAEIARLIDSDQKELLSSYDISPEVYRADAERGEVVAATADAIVGMFRAEIARLTAELAEARAAQGALIEKAVEACAEYPRIAPDETEWPHYDDQIAHSQDCIRTLSPDATAALAEHDKRVREAVLREAAKILDLWLCRCGNYFHPKDDCSCGDSNWMGEIGIEEAKHRIIALIDQPKEQGK